MKNFRNLRKEAAGEDVSSYSSRRLATILKDPKHPMHAVAKGEMDRRKMKSEGNEIDEISLAHLTKKIADSGGMKQVAKANKADKLKKDLEAMKKRMATEEQECPHCDMEDGEHEKDCPMMQEKTLTPAEKKKREEIAKAMERDNPGMPMAKKMAIATATAKKVAEEAKPDAVEVMRKKQQMANISTSDKDKLAKIRAMLDKEKKK